jgi:hypothetical protein
LCFSFIVFSRIIAIDGSWYPRLKPGAVRHRKLSLAIVDAAV